MLSNGGFKNVNYPNKIKVPQQKKGNLLVVSISIALILLIIGAGGYYYFVWKQGKEIRDIVESIGQLRQPVETLREPQTESTPTDETTRLATKASESSPAMDMIEDAIRNSLQ